MGIFGALTTAVTGLRAQSFALENISGNIANSQTTGFKRVDTSFQDMIPDNPPDKQLAGTVTATARSTNTVQGDFQSASIGTFMAINGEGFFVVQKPSNFSDGRPTFDGSDLYTRRGDFQTDKDGYLVNGAGYYLMGIPVNSATGNVSGSVPQLLKFQNDFLPAEPTSQIQYRANLADYPLTQAHDKSVLGSELIDPKTFSANPVAGSPQPAKITGFGASISGDANAAFTGTQVVPASLANGGSFTINGQIVNLVPNMTRAQVLAAINAPVKVTGTGGFTGAGSTVGGAPAGITIQAAGLNGGARGERQHDRGERYGGTGRDQDQRGARGRNRRRGRHPGLGRGRTACDQFGLRRHRDALRRQRDVDGDRQCAGQPSHHGRHGPARHADGHARRNQSPRAARAPRPTPRSTSPARRLT